VHIQWRTFEAKGDFCAFILIYSVFFMNILAVIPSRYGSTRFPGKPLVMIDGLSMIQRVYLQTMKCSLISKVIAATDDHRIFDHVAKFGGEAIMTSADHRSGTDRIGEVLDILNSREKADHFDLIINVQGDEPFLDPSQLELLITSFSDSATQIATLKKEISNNRELQDPNVVKVVTDDQQNALYFSRSTIPYLRGTDMEEWLAKGKHYKHIGLYAYRTQVFKDLIKLKPTYLEQSESLEQLRWMENGFKIKVIATTLDTIAIDTPEDLLKLTNKV
jgi:3-deoxy-manno-octulosonate cytidylyltransferase (CMP-KDO synthetase)